MNSTLNTRVLVAAVGPDEHQGRDRREVGNGVGEKGRQACQAEQHAAQWPPDEHRGAAARLVLCQRRGQLLARHEEAHGGSLTEGEHHKQRALGKRDRRRLRNRGGVRGKRGHATGSEPG
jgi:hypothetical protein